MYQTKYADCLSRKSVVFEVFDHNRFSSNELIGSCKVDLHTIATGCVTHELPIRDGRKTRGSLRVEITMEQTSSIELRMVTTQLRASGAASGALSGLPGTLELSCHIPAGPCTEKIGAQTTSSAPLAASALMAASGWAHPDVLYAEGTLSSLCDLELTYALKTAAGGITQGAKTLATGTLKLGNAYTFIEGETVEFSVPLIPEPGSPLPPGASVGGAFIYLAFPVFTQMAGGLHTEAGIKGAVYTFPDIPFRPRCATLDESGKDIEGARVIAAASKSLRAGKGGAGPASAAATAAASKSAAAGGAAPGTSASSATGPLPAGAARTGSAVLQQDISLPMYQPGNPHGLQPPSVQERLFGGAPGLPVCWVRKEDVHTGAVKFENLATGLVEADMPKDMEYVITLPATDTPGPLGLQLEPNFSGTARNGFKSGRRNSGYDLGAVVRGLKPESPLQAAGKVRPGHHLIAINGSSTLKLTFDATVAVLRAATRPLILRFHDPYAVPADLAVQARKANLSAKQSAKYGAGTRMAYASAGLKPAGTKALPPGKPLSGPNSAGNGGVGAGQYDQKTVAEASKTLNMALDLLARTELTAALANSGEGRELQKAIGDAGFLRSLTAVITGTAGDAAPGSIRDRLEEEHKEAEAAAKAQAQAELEVEMRAGWAAAGGAIEEEKKDDAAEAPDATDSAYGEESTPLGATAKALTSDASAAKALMAVANIAASSTQAAERLAELGVFQRSVAAVGARPSAEVAASALSAVATAGPALASVSKGGTLEEGVKALGLGGPSLIILQSAARRHEYVPEAVERTNQVLGALALDNPEQDGMGYLTLVSQAVYTMAQLAKEGYSRALAPDGNTFYILPDGESVWDPPEAIHAAYTLLKDMDRRTRVIEDGAIVSAAAVSVRLADASGVDTDMPLTVALPLVLTSLADDGYVAAAFLAAASKVAAIPANAVALVKGDVLRAADAALAAHPTEPRIAEVFASLQFNIGRDLDSSETLLLSGSVAKVAALAKAYLKHKSSWTGSPSPWAPEGHEAEVGETIVLPGVDRNAREKNALRPRLVRSCINVLINLACYRRPVVVPSHDGGQTTASSVDMIVACEGVPLLGTVLLSHINDSSVVTSVLNCAANIAFKNREVQLAIGEAMCDAIILSGWSFQKDPNLISMALRAIGNMTNEDLNIYRGLGYGVVRMIAAAMRNNATNVPLQTLAASVLSNIASVEALEDAQEAAEDVSMFAEVAATRAEHPALALRPSPADAALVQQLLSEGKRMWQIAPWLLVQEGAVACLTFAMTKYAQDVNLVEACLRTIHSICNEEDVSVELVARQDIVSRVLFVMRACDFDVTVQASGASILASVAGLSSCAAAVANSDAAHTLMMALDTHKSTLTTALAAAAHAVGNAHVTASHGSVDAAAQLLGAMDPYLEGKPMAVLGLLMRACDVIGLMAGPRATKAALELYTPATLVTLLTSAVTLCHTLAVRGFSFTQPQAASRALQEIVGFTEAAATLLGELLRHPAGRAGVPMGPDGKPFLTADEEAACFSMRSMVSQGGRAWPNIVRLLELALAAPPGSASVDGTTPVPLAATPKVLRALLTVPAGVILRAPVLPDRSGLTKAALEAAGLPPGSYPSYPGTGNVLDVEAQGVDSLAAAGMGQVLAQLTAALTHYVVAALQNSAALYSARGTVQWDSASVAGRAGLSTCLVLLDAMACVCTPPQPTVVTVMDEATGQMVQVQQAPPAYADALTAASVSTNTCAGLLTTASTALQGFVQGKDLVLSPLKISEICDLAARCTSHIGSRAAVAGSGPVVPLIPASEARAIMTYSVTRARASAQVAGHTTGTAAYPTTMPAYHAPMAAAPPPAALPQAPPSAPPADDMGAAGAGATGAPAPGSSDATKRGLKRSNSMKRAIVGGLTDPQGVPAVAWIDGKPQVVILRCDEAVRDLQLFPRPEKPGGKLAAGLDPNTPLAIVPGGAYAVVRIGKPMKDGKAVTRGLFVSSKSDKTRTVCLDSAVGNTIVELECQSTKEAEKLKESCEGLAESAARQMAQ